MPTQLIVILLALAGACQILGTATVWTDYKRGARLADSMLQQVATEEAETAQLAGTPMGVLRAHDEHLVPFRVTANEERVRELSAHVAHHLSRRRTVPLGLVTVIVGAVLAAVGGIAALVR